MLKKLLVLGLILSFKLHAIVLNDPYPFRFEGEKVFYSNFTDEPKTLDPARSYSSNEYIFLSQIYEPLLQYDYFKRPYTLAPLTTTTLPQVSYVLESGEVVEQPVAGQVKETLYTITLKPGIYYQPHPCFAKDKNGEEIYPTIDETFLKNHDIQDISDFRYTGTRELVAEDYIYQIKRLANPKNHSPIYGLMSEYIVGFEDYYKKLPIISLQSWLDLRTYSLEGLNLIDSHTFQIRTKGFYPQFEYWLSMIFFSPMPYEADRFYAYESMQRHDIDLDAYPVGTGPFMMETFQPNLHIILKKNPNFRDEFFPSSNDPLDIEKGYTQNTGKKLPFLDKVVFTLEKESIPTWTKFLQGYYDVSGISMESFDQTVKVNLDQSLTLTPEMKAKNLQFLQADLPSITYTGFNMLDPVVGGDSIRAKKLRQALSIAVSMEESIIIFQNGRGTPAQGPLPPGIFGFLEGEVGINPYVYDFIDGRPVRKDIQVAQNLLAEAGYPDGIDPKTHRPLILHYDVMGRGSPDEKAYYEWMVKQFKKLGISLDVRVTTYNRFQDKMNAGQAQIYSWGWNADYPDPENFLFLLYGPNGKVKYNGENASNYNNERFNRLYLSMKDRPNDEERQNIINEMIKIVQKDAPWIFGVTATTYILKQPWVMPQKPNTMSYNTIKYININAALREQLIARENQAILWPIGALLLLKMVLVFFIFKTYKRYQDAKAQRYYQ